MVLPKTKPVVKVWPYEAVNKKRIVEFETLLSSTYAYSQGLVKMIADDQRDHQLKVMGDYFKASNMQIPPTIKIEGIERYNEFFATLVKKVALGFLHKGPVSCHLFWSKPGSPSFPDHTDPDDVVIYVAQGSKLMIVNGEQHWIREGQYLLIPANTPHRAENREGSFMFSIGLEKYIKDKL